MMKKTTTRKHYLTPATQVERVAVESSVCASSVNIKAKTDTPNVEVDEWDSIENGVTFD